MTNSTTDSSDATLFGMPVRTGRWAFVLAGMLMNVCLGAVYAWSVFRKPVEKLFSWSFNQRSERSPWQNRSRPNPL